jgi:metallophosphoesterase (TIGR03767 family)
VKALAALAALLSLAGAAVAARAPIPHDTLRWTILDRNGDNTLEYASGEPRVTRTDLAVSSAPRSRTLLAFVHFADTQLMDEESPGRVELVDFMGGDPFGSSYRPQEGLMPHVLNEEIREVRALTKGPATGAPIRLVMTGGDNTDNAQLNETRWFIDIMDGGRVVNPDSGRRGTCGLKNQPVFTGMRGGGRFYEPNGKGDGPGYSPSMVTNRRSVGRSTAMRDFPGLFEQMNRPFKPVGLGKIPWYALYGNHDALVQGNFAQNELFDRVVAGCRKVTRYSPEALAQIRPLLADGVTPSERAQIIQITFGDYLDTWGVPREHKGLYKTVPSDPARRFLRKTAWMREHFKTRGLPRGHGFTQANLTSGRAYYAFSPAAGLRFITLDTTADGSSSGNLDEEQFGWLDGQLAAAEARRELVVAFGHHSIRSLNAAGSGVRLGPDVEALFRRHPGVVAYVAGHEHRNRIEPHGSFWELVTASHIEWPQQSRAIELARLADGTLAIYSTAIDHLASAKPPSRRQRSTGVQQPIEVLRLASIARELSLNEPQAENGEDGWVDRRGGRLDRNVALLLRTSY